MIVWSLYGCHKPDNHSYDHNNADHGCDQTLLFAIHHIKRPLSERMKYNMKYIFIYLICFLIFCAWLFYEQRKSQRAQKKASDEFWAREELANSTRKKDISHLPLIQVEESEIPSVQTHDESILHAMEQLHRIIHEPMIDLSEYSNTDLKLAYGVGNFKTLSEYDENFGTFLMALTDLARAFAHGEYYEQAEQTYLMALRHGSRKACDYEELANLYLDIGRPDKVRTLIHDVETGEHPRRDTIAAMLRQVMTDHE